MCFDAHDVVRAAVGLARDDGELGHRGLAVGVEQLGAVADDAAVLLRVPGRKPGTSSKVTIGMLKASQKRMKRAPSSTRRCRGTGQHRGLVGDDADDAAAEAREADRRCCARSRAWTSRNVPSSTTRRSRQVHVVGLVRDVRARCVERRIRAVARSSVA
jgi:hypothetical protein